MSNQQQPRFTHTHDAAGAVLTVIDSSTGLEWTPAPVGGKRHTHQEALDACAALDHAGHTDWALPTRQQLLSLVDLTRHDPAIDTDAFPGFPASWFWSSDLAAWSSASAWLVGFSYGGVGLSPRFSDGFALAVRRAGQ
ncbi:DUF1566 domain-containing protein [Xanthomonas sp. XNM01]|uniref:Lcl C-terminal domain-containing protein n=1 Tax=Xanthomonas sp. XNM01 TaxID=2769289 RepID=UPI00178678C7|nr:DUF1566 domain-containing protein [Xanthomonas sp. XNM01]MBD9368832.1 DUF1566 domain-containing protein [Xanthomonas sp. XNM01]